MCRCLCSKCLSRLPDHLDLVPDQERNARINRFIHGFSTQASSCNEYCCVLFSQTEKCKALFSRNLVRHDIFPKWITSLTDTGQGEKFLHPVTGGKHTRGLLPQQDIGFACK